MVARLAVGDATVGELAAPYDVSVQAVSKHIKVLEHAGLVRRVKHGREHTLELDAAPLQQVSKWVHRYEQYWSERLDRLEAFFAKREAK